MNFYCENPPFCCSLWCSQGAAGYRSSVAWCVWSSKKHVSCVTMLVRVLLTGAAADAKYVGSLGTVEWTKGSQLSQTSSSFIVVLYAVGQCLSP